jgi:hypothetical protein
MVRPKGGGGSHNRPLNTPLGVTVSPNLVLLCDLLHNLSCYSIAFYAAEVRISEAKMLIFIIVTMEMGCMYMFPMCCLGRWTNCAAFRRVSCLAC